MIAVTLGMLAVGPRAASQESLGKIEKLEGELFVFTDPKDRIDQKKLPPGSTQVLFKKKYWIESKLNTNDSVFAADYLRCKKDCRVLIRFDSGTRVLILANSHLSIDAGSLFLNVGSLRAVSSLDQPHLTYHVKNLVVAPTAADIFIETKPTELNLVVLKGNLIAKSPANTLELEENKSLSIFSDKKDLPESQMTTSVQQEKIRQLSINMIEDGTPAKAQEEVTTSKYVNPPAEDFTRNPFSVGTSVQIAFPTSLNEFQYSKFDAFAEYDFLKMPVGLGLVLSAYSFDLSITEGTIVPASQLELGSIGGRVFCRIGYLRLNIDTIFAGGVDLVEQTTETEKRAHYKLAGTTAQLAANLPISERIFARAGLGYGNLYLTNADTKLSANNFILSGGLVLKF